MSVITKEIRLKTAGNTEVIDITEILQEEVDSISIKNGLATVFVPGSTGGITTIEYEYGVVNDFKNAMERLVPEKLDYQHDLAWKDGNGYSHVRSSIIGTSLTIPLVNGILSLGQWQQVVFIDFDNRSRSRKLIVQVLGE